MTRMMVLVLNKYLRFVSSFAYMGLRSFLIADLSQILNSIALTNILYKTVKEQVFNGPRASFTRGQSKYAMFQSAERDSFGKL